MKNETHSEDLTNEVFDAAINGLKATLETHADKCSLIEVLNRVIHALVVVASEAEYADTIEVLSNTCKNQEELDKTVEEVLENFPPILASYVMNAMYEARDNFKRPPMEKGTKLQ